ncbi:MAG: sulfurtransferase [Ferruginibacter sp.]
MSRKISPIIQATELLNLYQTGSIVLVDASNDKHARHNYNEKHLDGAIFIDTNIQLADIKEDASIGGRHPLPTVEKFSQTLSELGIAEKSHVIIYDHQNGSNAAARFWWMLRSVGHEKVQVLNGGFATAEKVGFPANSNEVQIKKEAPYKITEWKLPTADMDEVERVVQDNDHIVIDVRDTNRFKGLTEPIDLVAGHIPGAINVPFTTNLNDQGLFIPPGELKKKYQEVFGDVKTENIIVHCGSGVTACHTLLAVAYAGMEIPKLYVGSWSEWSRNNKTIVTGS